MLRLATVAARTAARPAAASFAAARRGLSGATRLVATIDSELAEEGLPEHRAMSSELEACLVRLKANPAFAVEEEAGSCHVKLTLGSGATVDFDVRGTSEIEDDDGYAFDDEGNLVEDEADGGEAAEGDESAAINFVVSVEKEAAQLQFACVSAGGFPSIEGVSLTKPGQSSDPDGLGEERAYTGPVFDELDMDVQGAMEKYLEGNGVDEDLCNFIEMYADFKEHQEYISWLENVKAFVEE